MKTATLLALLLFSCSTAPGPDSMTWEGDTLTLNGYEIGLKIPGGYLLEWPPESGSLELWRDITPEGFRLIASGLYLERKPFEPGK